MPSPKKVVLSLRSRCGKTSEVVFRPLETGSAERWVESLKKANQSSTMRETQRIYNFPGSDSKEEQIIKNIESCISKLHKGSPEEIPLMSVDRDNPQESVNKIHIHFVDNDRLEVPGEMASIWNDLNVNLHAYESFLRSRETFKDAGMPEANIVVTWNSSFREELKEEDYEHFTIAKQFGTCYVNYCQVGRHLYEMFLSDDEVAKDEHILPLRHLSADTYIWLGTTTGPKSLKSKEEAVYRWFKKNEKRLNSLGFNYGDPRLAIGWLPVARIESLPEEQLAYLEQLGDVVEVETLKVE